MTILDVLRYPVTDIYNLGEIDALPANLFIDWATECSGQPRERIAKAEASAGLTRKSITHAMVLAKVQTETRRQHRNSGWTDLYKAQFLKRLKEMIAEYEPI